MVPPCPPALRSRLLPAHHHHGGAFGTRWPVDFRVCVCVVASWALACCFVGVASGLGVFCVV